MNFKHASRIFFLAAIAVVAGAIAGSSSSLHAQVRQVSLVSQDPVFSRVEIPGGFDGGGGYYPFNGIQWLQAGYFVVSGYGNSNAFVNNFPQAAGRVFESGGMYLIRESDGRFLGVRDVVFDTSTRAFGCFENFGCSAGRLVHPLTSNRFIRDLEKDGVIGWRRSPVIYDATPSGFRLVHRLWFNTLFQTPQSGGLTYTDDVAVSGDKIIMVARRNVASSEANRNEIYDVNFNLLASFSQPWTPPPGPTSGQGQPGDALPLYKPIVGVGDYFLALDFNQVAGSAGPPVKVYRMPDAGLLLAGQAPQHVESLSVDAGPNTSSLFTGWNFDTRNPNRVATMWRISHFGVGAPPATKRLVIYEAGQNGLNIVLERDITPPPGLELPGSFFSQSNFAVSGDYLAYGACPPRSKGTEKEGCVLVVQNVSTGETLEVDPLPPPKYPDPATSSTHQEAGSVSISPSGKILVATDGGRDNGNLYLYQIGGVSGGTGDDGGDDGADDSGGDLFSDSDAFNNLDTGFLDFDNVVQRIQQLLNRINVLRNLLNRR